MTDRPTMPDAEMKITRVVVNRAGYANPPRLARDGQGNLIRPDIVFIRDDGWSLGAPRALAEVAQGLWAEDWVEIWTREGDVWTRTWAKTEDQPKEPRDMIEGELIEWVLAAQTRRSRGSRKGRACQILKQRTPPVCHAMILENFKQALADATPIRELKDWALS